MKFQGKYRIESARAPFWDYRWNSAYFITICTQNRAHFFGEIVDGKMRYSPIGAVADVLWSEIPNHHPNVLLGEFVVMPNHVHGIIILNNPVHEKDEQSFKETGLDQQPNHPEKDEFMSSISPKSGSVSSIIRSYKSAVTKHANRLGLSHQWQTRFYDNIIRETSDFERITQYIIDNPSKWKEDRFWDE